MRCENSSYPATFNPANAWRRSRWRSAGRVATPVRLALGILESEGLVAPAPKRGFIVRRISAEDVLAGFDVRGVLEGLACLTLAEKGLTRDVEAAISRCIDEGEALCALGHFDAESIRRWTDMNRRFHEVILEAAGNHALQVAHELICRHPLVGPGSLAFNPDRLADDFTTITHNQREHRAILDALRNGQGARAEYLAKEHIRQGRDSNERLLRRLGKLV